jgi:lysosomal alpha-mannosidase
MGLAQHHDAVSGTEKQEVAYDYAQRLSTGIDAALVSSEFDKQLYVAISRLPLFLECY